MMSFLFGLKLFVCDRHSLRRGSYSGPAISRTDPAVISRRALASLESCAIRWQD